MRFFYSLFIFILYLSFLSTSFSQEPNQSAESTNTDKQVLLWKVPQSGQKAFIPDISLIGSFAFAYFNHDPIGDQGANPSRTGFNLQGIEMAIQSVVDPYIRADIFIHFHEDAVEIEHAEITTLSLPLNLQIKAGKLLGNFGRENLQHTEQLNFVDTSRLNRYFFGNEGFKELGVEVSVLLPLDFYSQIAFQFLQGENTGNFDGVRKSDFAYLVRSINAFDLTSELTLKTGLSSAFGFNDTASGNLTQLYGGDVYLRWKFSEHKGLKWQSEFIFRNRSEVLNDVKEGGLDTQLIWQWARRWESGFRFDWIGIPDDNGFSQKAYAADLTFLASEFFKIRTQYNFIKTNLMPNNHEFFLQAQFNIGPHGAHEF